MPRVGGALAGENPLPHDPPALGLDGLDGGRDARKLPLRDVVRLRARLRDAGETGVEAPDRPDFCEESTRDIRWSVLASTKRHGPNVYVKHVVLYAQLRS